MNRHARSAALVVKFCTRNLTWCMVYHCWSCSNPRSHSNNLRETCAVDNVKHAQGDNIVQCCIRHQRCTWQNYYYQVAYNLEFASQFNLGPWNCLHYLSNQQITPGTAATAATRHHTSSCRSCRMSCRMSGQLDVLPALEADIFTWHFLENVRL